MYILILLFALFAFASNGLAKLYLYLIRKGQLFSFMQKPIVYLQDKKNPLAIFAYKSIGGCEVCTIQRFADVAFIVLIYMAPIHLHWLLWTFLYCLFGGLSFYATMLTQREQTPKTTQKINLQ
jgi:hypothetical protein